MLLLAFFIGCPIPTGVGVLPVCPDATILTEGATVTDGDTYELCVESDPCPGPSELDEDQLIEDLGLVTDRGGCDVDGSFDCGPVTTDAGCCYTLTIELQCIDVG